MKRFSPGFIVVLLLALFIGGIQYAAHSQTEECSPQVVLDYQTHFTDNGLAPVKRTKYGADAATGANDRAVCAPGYLRGQGGLVIYSRGSQYIVTSGTGKRNKFASSVDYLGDINADGIDDWIVGIPYMNFNNDGAHVLSGGAFAFVISNDTGYYVSIIDGNHYALRGAYVGRRYLFGSNVDVVAEGGDTIEVEVSALRPGLVYRFIWNIQEVIACTQVQARKEAPETPTLPAKTAVTLKKGLYDINLRPVLDSSLLPPGIYLKSDGTEVTTLPIIR